MTGAGRRIGEACARELARSGYACVLMSPSQRSVDLAAELGGVGIRGSASDLHALAQLVDRAMSRYGRIDAVVNNTGNLPGTRPAQNLPCGHGYDLDPPGELLHVADEEWRQSLDHHFLNVVRLTRMVTPALRGQGGGAIVNILGMSALEPRLSYPLTSAIRAATLAFGKLFSDQFGRAGIRMYSVLSGSSRTGNSPRACFIPYR
jgi:NAD(P)-dependent dehydrogenase (short-subunit alcohol dehydrogenase family)